ncbi:MAG TPA: translocation/assembly module TamB domain-containing protein [Anaeromyxobacter sp.]
MARTLRRVAAAIGWTVLGIAAAIGVGLAALSFLATAPFSRGFVASRVVRVVDEAIAGHVALKSVVVLPGGGVELEGLEITDPEGHLVLSVGRARLSLDLTGLRRRIVRIAVELEAPSVMVEEERGGGTSIARAFAPSNPSPKAAPAQPSAWSVHVSRLAIRSGDVWWVDARHETRVEAGGLDVDARGIWSARRTRVELRLSGDLDEPVPGRLSVELAGGTDGTAVRLPVLRASLGETSVALVGEGDLARRTGRLAALRVDVARDLARTMASRVPGGDDLEATGYAEADGATLTAAVRAEPTGGAGAAGRGGVADAAIALRLSEAARALGFDVALDRLDPSRLAAQAPPGRITLSAHGAAEGGSLRELRGRIEARVQASRLRGGEIRSAELVARADHGTIDVSRATLSAPGISLDAAVHWRDRGAVGGRLAAEASDLEAAVRNASALAGRRPPALSGRARVEGTFGGTADAPRATAAVDASSLRLGGVGLAGARLTVEGAGPLRTATVRVDGRVASVRSGGTELARAVSLHGSLAEDVGALDATASLPGFDEPARIEARGRLSSALETLAVSTLTISYPGTRWTLAAPATVTLAGPSVDRLDLVDGVQRIELVGGLTEKGALDARASLARLDLARLPLAPLRRDRRLRGELGADVRATGRPAHPEVTATFTLGAAALGDLAGIAAAGTATWSGATRRATGSLSVSRDAATIDLAADLPLPLAGRAGEAVRATARGAGVPLRDLLAAAGSGVDADGVLSFDGSVQGTVGAPALRLDAAASGARWGDLERLALEASAVDAGQRVALSARLSLDGAAVANARLEAPLVLADLLARPALAVRALRAAPLTGSAAVTGLELASISGRAGVPRGLAGHVDAAATLSGSTARPRAEATVDLSQGAWAGYRDVGAHAALSLGAASTSASGRVAIGGDEAVRFGIQLGAPPEKLASLAALRAAALRAEIVVPRIALERAGTLDLPLAGTISGKLEVSGTPGAPQATLLVEGEQVAISGRPLGRARLEAGYARARTTGSLLVAPPTGGTLRAKGTLQADLGVGASRPSLGEAPAEISAVADALDLSVLAALLPGRVRSSSGRLDADVSLRGPLSRLVPRGTARVRDGRVAVLEYGEFTGIALDAGATQDAVEVTRLEVRRGKGKLTATAAVRGLASAKARLEGHLEASAFTVSRAGMEVATVDLAADASGTWANRTVSVDVTIPHGTIRLPKKQARPLQPIVERKDIVIGRPEARRLAVRSSALPAPGLALVVHVVVPRQLFLKGEDPRMDIELKADATYEASGGEDYARGYVETVRGTVEPIAGRTFTIERGRVQFTGGPPAAATLDFEARYDNPAAVVTAKVTGPVRKPEITLTSQPPMDEAQIALLIATGQRDLKAGTASVGTLTGAEAGKAALGALATTAFRDLVANKLPIDTFSLDSGAIRAGKYVTDKIYVGYVRRFEADPTKGENTDEVRVEYHITPRWNFESRYGSQAGGASLIWSKDF